MNHASSRAHLIEQRLLKAFAPTFLEVIDESDSHIGHAGHQGGGRHFAIRIMAESLNSLPKIEAHRQVYALFSDMIPEQIHALKIKLEQMTLDNCQQNL